LNLQGFIWRSFPRHLDGIFSITIINRSSLYSFLNNVFYFVYGMAGLEKTNRKKYSPIHDL